jgi:hypothetical protein
MQGAVAGVDLLEEQPHLLAIGDVAGNGEHLGVHGLQFVFRPTELFFIAGTDDQAHTFARELASDGETETAGCACNQCDFSANADLAESLPCSACEEKRAQAGNGSGGHGACGCNQEDITDSHESSPSRDEIRMVRRPLPGRSSTV